jgi:hypothetical protein
MKTLLAATALTLAFGSSAFAFDTATQAIIDRHKANKPVSISDIATLMQSSERWCYLEDAAGTCSWSDIYLDVTDSGAEFEIGNAWSETVDIVFTDTGTFEDGRSICETGVDWVPTIRAVHRADGSMLLGRELQSIKAEVAATQSDSVVDCFDYLYLSSDAEAQTVTLLQRQTTADVYDPAKDTEVTLHFDPANAAALTWRW